MSRAFTVVLSSFGVLMWIWVSTEPSYAQWRALKTEVDEAGFHAVYPPRANYSPGRLYRIVRDSRGRQQEETVCRSIFESTPQLIESSNWQLRTRNEKRRFSLSAIFDWFGSKVQRKSGEQAANAEGSLNWSQAIVANFHDVKHNSVPLENRFSEASPISVTENCRNALEAHRNIDPRLRNLFIVAETLSSNKIELVVDRDIAMEVGFTANLNEIVSVTPNAGVEIKANNSIIGETDHPIIFAQYSLPIKRYSTQVGLVGGGNLTLEIDFSGEREALWK